MFLTVVRTGPAQHDLIQLTAYHTVPTMAAADRCCCGEYVDHQRY